MILNTVHKSKIGKVSINELLEVVPGSQYGDGDGYGSAHRATLEMVSFHSLFAYSDPGNPTWFQ